MVFSGTGLVDRYVDGDVFVMNENGKTVSIYRLYPLPDSEPEPEDS